MMEDVTHNAADPKEVKKAQRRELSGRKREISDIRQILATLPGRRTFWRYLTRCGMHKTSFTQGDPYRTAFNEGNRNAGLLILNDIMEAAPEAYLTMINENRSKQYA